MKSSVAEPVKQAIKASFVQAGAFSSYDNAVRLSKTLSVVGGSIISPIDVNGKTLYRVRIGPAYSKQDAEILLTKVKAFEHSGARIVEDKFVPTETPIEPTNNVKNIINNQ